MGDVVVGEEYSDTTYCAVDPETFRIVIEVEKVVVYAWALT
jgi:hypothetical protein